MSRTANVVEWLAWALGIITGSLDRPRGTWFNPGFFRQNDRVALQSAPPEGNVAPGPKSRPELSGRNNQLPAVAIPDEIDAGNLQAFFAVGGFNEKMISCEDDDLGIWLNDAGFKLYQARAVRAIHAF